MCISDWSSDVCSSDLRKSRGGDEAEWKVKEFDGQSDNNAADLAEEENRLRLEIQKLFAKEGFKSQPLPASSSSTSSGASSGKASSNGRATAADRKSVGSGKSVLVRVDHGGRRI